jgi:hypothetical protein
MSSRGAARRKLKKRKRRAETVLYGTIRTFLLATGSPGPATSRLRI